MFHDELQKAKGVVQEPPQPKIKIKKTPGGQDTPASSKKITIHVANTRGSSAESPAPKTAGSASSDAAATNGATSARGAAVDRVRGVSHASPSPSVAAGAKRESSSRASPALQAQRPNGTGPNGTPAGETPSANGAAADGAANGTQAPAAPPAPVVPPRPAYESRFRPTGRGMTLPAGRSSSRMR